jgi:hypothetical protein
VNTHGSTVSGGDHSGSSFAGTHLVSALSGQSGLERVPLIIGTTFQLKTPLNCMEGSKRGDPSQAAWLRIHATAESKQW